MADRDGVEYSAEELGKVAATLREKLRELQGGPPPGQNSSAPPLPGSFPDVVANGSALEVFAELLEEMKNWPGGQSFAAALRRSGTEPAAVYQQVNEKLMIALTLIDVGAGTYKVANAANGA
ncbi:hypothetical protein ACIBEJ_04995 [Nonomuraea sp. NPDC050790]|uniref:hypothetical protein n=1 Tax=Nonomuraea sp. NPDC050790 TaxID=3364371 RepID=UPI00379C7198